jgi:biopolymer transport protein ExbD
VIKVLLPTSKAAQSLNKQQITLTVTNDKKYFINQKEVPMELLEQTLKETTKGLEGPTIILRFAKTLNIQDLVDVLEIGVRLNLKMVMATDKS